jgi:pimeloyl-ACP methyl ester carboxylesterase
MKCPACFSEIDDRAYRCRECRRICSYRRLARRYRFVLLLILIVVAYYAGRSIVQRVRSADFTKLPDGALVSDSMTRAWLGLNDKDWFCEEPHYKGNLLHLRHKVFQAKDVIVFIHGFIGDYVNTWGKPKVLLEDPRFNRNYDFVFYGFKTALFGDVPAFDEEAAKLDRTLTHLEEDYKSITIVTHSKGGLLAMRTLLNRAHDFPAKQPYKIHRIVMFTPLTENVSLGQLPEFVKLLGKKSPDIAQMQADTYSELGKVKEDAKALLNPQDAIAETRKEAFIKNVAEHLYVINAEGDEIVDVGPNGEKVVSEGMRKLSELPTLGVPRLVTLRYSDIGGAEEDARRTKSGVRDPSYAHGIVVKMGSQDAFSFFDHFDELLFDRIGVPPRNLAGNVEQIRQNTHDRIEDTIFEMNKFVVDRNPMVGLAWKDINDAVQAKFKDVAEPARTKQMEDLTKQTYYVYIFLSLYARMDNLRSRGILSPNDDMIVTWQRSWLPNLMRSELGRWMLDNNLMEYYSETMIKDLRDAASAPPPTTTSAAQVSSPTSTR